jgi:ABC-type polysaccharide/polyol phosphate export permease
MLTTQTLVEAPPPSGVLHDLREIVRDTRASRGLVYQLTLRDIRVRYKQAVMGFAWAILAPMLVVAAGVVARVGLLHMAGERFTISAVTGIVVKGLGWAFVSGAVGFSTTALTGNAPLISKVYFPRQTLPLSIILASAFDSLIGTTALTLLLPLTGWRPTWAVLWAPLLAAVLFAFTLGVGLLVSCANLFFRDVKYIVQLLITFGIFFTPVFYEPSVLGARWVPVQMLNPLAPILEGLRLSVGEGHNLLMTIVQASDGAVVWTPVYLLYSMVWAIGLLVLSAVIFHRAHFRFAEYV